MSTTLFIFVLVLGASLIAIKIYLEEKHKKNLKNEESKEIEKPVEQVKTHEQVVAERLQEIAQFEKEVIEKKAELIEPLAEAPKPKAKNVQKKSYKPKKQQPKMKAK